MYGNSDQAGAGKVVAGQDVGPLLRAQVSFSRVLWRIGPAWSVLFGAVAGGWAPAEVDAILRLGAAILLGDLAWGSLRQLLPQGPINPPVRAASLAPVVPYALPDAPLVKFLNSLTGGTGLPAEVAWQPLAVGVALTAALSLLLGPAAVVLSLGALLLLALAWLLTANRGSQAAFSLALLDVAFPGLLGLSLVGDALFVDRGWAGPVALLSAFTLLQWGVLRMRRREPGLPVSVWVGQLAVLVALIALRQAWACALVAVLFALPSWSLLRSERTGGAHALPWWWAAYGAALMALR